MNKDLSFEDARSTSSATRGAASVALVVPDPTLAGGVSTVALFLFRGLALSDSYRPSLISLATSAVDGTSKRVLSPCDWRDTPRTAVRSWREIDLLHVGAKWVEFESFRYEPREILTSALRTFDLVQIVAGTPAWANVARDCRQPVALQVASRVSVERKSKLDGAWYTNIYSRLSTRMNERIERSILPTLDAVFVENDWMYGYCSEMVGQHRVHFAPPGVDTDFFHPGIHATLMRPGSTKVGAPKRKEIEPSGYILSVGRFSDRRKNVRLLFDAYARLRQRMSRVPRLVLAGTAPNSDDLSYMRSLRIADSTSIHERVSQPDLVNLYRGAHLFVLSSNEEGLGMVILEAMACGLSVVSTDCGGPATAVIAGETGLLTPVGDANALAEAMERLLEDPESARRMGQAGRARIEAEFSMPVAAKRFTDVYDQLLARR